MKQFLNKLTSMILVLSMFVTLSMPAVGEGSVETVPEQNPAVAQTEETQVPETVIEDPVIEEPAAEEPIINEEPVVPEPAVEEPVTNDDPVTENPVIEEPVVTDPIIDEPIIDEPVVVEPTGEEPITDEPVVEEPVITEPVTEEPATEEPAEEPAELAEETEDEEANQPEEAEEEEALAEDAEPLVMRSILVGADEMAFRDQWQNPTEPLNWSNGVWYWLYGRGVEPVYNPNAVLVEISGMLPETVTAVARYIEYADAEVHSEVALMMLDVALYDADGMLYQPTEPLQVSVGSGKLYDAIANGKSFVGYFNDVDDRGLLFDSFAAAITVRTDEGADGSRLVYTPGQEGDSVCFRESGDALVPTESGTLDFEESGFPFRVLFSAQQADRTLYAESWNSSASVVVEGPLSENFYVEAASPDLALYDVEGSSLMSLDVSLALDNVGVCQPEAPVTVTISDSSIAEAINNGGELQLWSVESDGMAYEVPDATFYGDSVAFETGNVSQYIIQNITLSRDLVASDGSTYEITVTYPPNSGIPSNAELYVEELLPWTDAYYAYLTQSAAELGVDPESLTFARAFDITLVDPATGMHYQPNQNVQVSINLINTPLDNQGEISVLHFNDVSGGVEAMDYALNGEAIEFETGGFSVFMVMGVQLEKTITASDGNTYRISVTYDAAAGLPRDAELAVSELSGDAYNQYVALTAEAMGADALDYARIFDISIVGLDGASYQPNANVSVTIELMDAVPDDGVSVVHFGAQPELVEAAVDGGTINFETSSFSVYSLGSDCLRTYRFFTYDSAANMQYVEYYLYTDTGNTTFTQIIKSADEGLQIPQLPSLAGSETTTFSGWYAAEGVTSSNGVYTYTSISDTPFDFDNIPAVTETETVYLFAKFAKYAYVVFHDQYNGSTGTYPVALTRRGEIGSDGNAVIRIDDVSVAYDDDSENNSAPSMAFYGWSFTPISTPGQGAENVIHSDTVSITKSTDLYPIFQSIYWLSYSSGPTGSGATYIPATYYYVGDGPSSLSVPLRTGYTFDGWYLDAVTDEDGNITNLNTESTRAVRVSNASGSLINGATGTTASVSGGKLVLTNSTELTARWVVAPVQYTVVIWRQKATDQPNLADSAKTYDYAESIALSAQTGATVSVPNTYKTYDGRGDYVGFSYNRCDDSKQVADNGSTVLNVYYDRNVHTLTFRVSSGWSGYAVIRTITALYGSSIKDYFPIVGTNGTSYNGYSWTATNTQVYSYALATIETMPDADVTFNGASRGTQKTIYYYVEIGDESESLGTTRTFNNKLYTLYKTVNHNYNFITYDEEYHPISGYSRSRTNAQPAFGTDNRADIGNNNTNYLYYDREEYEIEFLDSYTSSFAYVNGAQLNTIGVKFSETIANYVPDDPTAAQIVGNGSIIEREGYVFTGWYTDSSCSTRVFFEENEEYQNYTGSKVPYDKMPAYNLRFYAGWETEWYLIEMDPNYGTMNSGTADSTWFWEPYNGDPIEEYTWVTRDYVESADGTFYYVKHDRAYYGYGDEFVEGENPERNTYYTTDLGEATELTTFKYAENAYRYAGWYEVHEDGSETLYNFGEPVTHNTKLVLHWKKIGTYYVEYNAGENGTLDKGDSNETLFVELDGDDYADNAEVVVTRIAKANEGYNFVGWTIRGDDSGTVYHPGQSFVMLSRYTAIVDGKETIFLDAVYTRVGTAKIVYDANGGSLDEATLDYGDPTGADAPEASKECDATAGTATISNLVNNSAIRLSSGAGFKMDHAELVGWNTKPDASGTHYDLSEMDENGNWILDKGMYYVDTEDPVTLYAEWQAKVFFHLNKPTTEANWGGTWNPAVYTDESDVIKYQTVYLNRPIDAPTINPQYTGEENLFFHFWGTQRYGDDETIVEYDFSQPVTGELHLYAYWAGPIEVPVHAVDSTNDTIMNMDSVWLTAQNIQIMGTPVSLASATDAARYTNVDLSQYEYVFAAAHSSTSGLQTISESEAITALYYNNAEKKVYVTYADPGKGDAPLADEDEIYFVYDAIESLNIGYKKMTTTGNLSTVTVRNAAPVSTGSMGIYNVPGRLTSPLSYPNDGSTYYYYAFAIGDMDTQTGISSANLNLITSTSSSNNNRPALQVRNTWRGFQYSLDNGSTWNNAGYEIQLYVLYFETETQPSVITIREQTIGTTADMAEEFEYVVVVTETTTTQKVTQRQRWEYSWQQGYHWENYGTPTESSSISVPKEIVNNSAKPYKLVDGETQPVTLFFTTESSQNIGEEFTSGGWGSATYRDVTTTTTITSQTITVTQRAKTGFITDNSSTAGTKTSEYVWTYTTTNVAANPVVTYTNMHTPLTVEVHVALVSGNTITLDDNDRKAGAATDYTITLPIDYPTAEVNTKTFLTEIHAEDLFTGDHTTYGFAGVIYGTSGDQQGDEVTVTGTGLTTVTYGNINGNIYEPYFNGDSTQRLENAKVYYLYYPLPKLVYVKEGAGGALTRIQGSTDGSTVTDTITYNGNIQNLNGTAVAQNQLLPVSEELFTISQTVETGIFNMPPMLDDGTDKLYLQYSKIGAAGVANAATTGSLDGVTESKTMYLKIDGNQVKWSLDQTTWNSFNGSAPTVYAIYRERGYSLEITKALANDTGYTASKTFTVTVRSMSITASSYAVTGTGYNTIAATPVSGSTPGSIVLSMRGGSDITISGLARGDYVITETGNENYTLTAQSGDAEGTLSDITVTDNQTLSSITLNGNKKVALTNTRKYVEITTNKILADPADTNIFTFTATLRDNGSLVANKTYGTGAVATNTDGNGTLSFDLAHNASRTLTIPVGADLTIQETNARTSTTTPEEVSLDQYIAVISAVETATTTIYSGGTITPDSKSYRFNAVPDRAVTVIFTNNPAGVDVLFKKIDGFGNSLNGATFTLFANLALDSGTGITGTMDGESGIVAFERVPNGVYYMRETTIPNGYVNENVYLLLVGREALTKTDLDPVVESNLSLISVADITRQTQQYKDTFGDDYGNYAIFLIQFNGTAYKAVTTPDIGKYGIMNIYQAQRKVILRKTDDSFNTLQGATFDILRYDRTVVESDCVSGIAGALWIGNLPYGTYYLHETMVGDTPVDKWFTLTVNESGAGYLQSGAFSNQISPGDIPN